MTILAGLSEQEIATSAAVLSAAMPEVERMEHEALGMSPFASLMFAARESQRDGELINLQDANGPLALAGVAPGGDAGVGVPWAAIHPRAWQRMETARRVMRSSRNAINRWQVEFPVLSNVMALANVTSGRYLRHLGFEFSAPFELKLSDGRVESFVSFSRTGLEIKGRW